MFNLQWVWIVFCFCCKFKLNCTKSLHHGDAVTEMRLCYKLLFYALNQADLLKETIAQTCSYPSRVSRTTEKYLEVS
jgi:hypothetical protein